MEDAHALIPALDGDKREIPRSFFAVYDGHGGPLVARYCGLYLHQTLQSSPQYQHNHLKLALERAYINTDKDLLTEMGKKRLLALSSASEANQTTPFGQKRLDAENQGCTAVSVLLDFEERQLYCANAGDSRAIIVRDGVCKALSLDHKPLQDAEFHRIEEAGGYVKNGRVNGNLNLSRTIGDLAYKHNYTLEPGEQIISCVPDVTIEPIDDTIDFIVLACDGVWDVLANEMVADFVRAMMFSSSGLTEQQRVDYFRRPDSESNASSSETSKTELQLTREEPWPGDVATSLEELLKLAAIRLINKCVAAEGSPYSVGCDNMTAVIVMTKESKFAQKVVDSIKTRLAANPEPAQPKPEPEPEPEPKPSSS